MVSQSDEVKKPGGFGSRQVKKLRAYDDLPLPEGALSKPEIVFENLISEEALKEFSRARKPANVPDT